MRNLTRSLRSLFKTLGFESAPLIPPRGTGRGKAHPVLEGMGNQKVSQMGVGVSDPDSPSACSNPDARRKQYDHPHGTVVLFFPARATGFEPVISSVTGRRHNQARPRPHPEISYVFYADKSTFQ